MAEDAGVVGGDSGVESTGGEQTQQGADFSALAEQLTGYGNALKGLYGSVSELSEQVKGLIPQALVREANTPPPIDDYDRELRGHRSELDEMRKYLLDRHEWEQQQYQGAVQEEERRQQQEVGRYVQQAVAYANDMAETQGYPGLGMNIALIRDTITNDKMWEQKMSEEDRNAWMTWFSTPEAWVQIYKEYVFPQLQGIFDQFQQAQGKRDYFARMSAKPAANNSLRFGRVS